MFDAKWRLSSAAKRLVTSLIALVLVLSLVSCGDRAQIFSKSDRLESLSGEQATKITEVSPPLVIQELRQVLGNHQPQVTILSPEANEVLQDNTVSVRFQVQDLPIFQNPVLGMGPHLHVFLDNHSYQAVYDLNEPLVLKDLDPGTHTLRVFASRPWHESFKNEGAYAQTTFHIFTTTDENNPKLDRPLLTYSRPQGSYGAEPIMLDFYLTNAPLHVVAQDDPEDDIADWKIRCTINGKSFIIKQWQPIYLKGFKPGNNWVQLELIDAKGNPIKNFFNNTARLITYEPNGQDTLAKLVRGDITSEEARGIVDPSIVTEKVEPTPAPTTEPTVDATPAPTTEPTVDTTTVTTAEPTVEIKVEVTPVTPAELTTEPTLDAIPVPTAEPTVEIKVEVTPVPNAEPTIEVTTTPQAQSPSEVVPFITPESFQTEPAKLPEIQVEEPQKLAKPKTTGTGFYNRVLPSDTAKEPIETAEPSPSMFSRFFNLFQRRDTGEVKPLPIPSPVVKTPVIQPVTPVVPVPQPEVSPETPSGKIETPVEETQKLDKKGAESPSSLPSIALPEVIKTQPPELASPEAFTSAPKTEPEEVPTTVEISPSPNVPLTLPEAIAPVTPQSETIVEPQVEIKKAPVEKTNKSTEKESQPPANNSVIEATTPAVPSALPEAIEPATPRSKNLAESQENSANELPPTLPEILVK